MSEYLKSIVEILTQIEAQESAAFVLIEGAKKALKKGTVPRYTRAGTSRAARQRTLRSKSGILEGSRGCRSWDSRVEV